MLVVHDVKGLCVVCRFFVFLLAKVVFFLWGFVVLFVFVCWF